MNSDLNTSPMTSAQSWIVENISSLISSNMEDENDCTLTMPSETKISKVKNFIDSDLEVEEARTLNEEAILTERIPKRPFSPEQISDRSTQNEQLQILYNNQQLLFNQMNQLQKNNMLDELRPLDFESQPLKPFPTSSSFYDDLNLEDCSKNNNKYLSNFINLQPAQMLSINQPGSQDSYYGVNDQSDPTIVKKKKLTNYSLSSSNIPMVSVTDTNQMNNSALASFNSDEDFSRNLSNSSYNTSFNSVSSSGISASSSYSGNLSNCFMNTGGSSFSKMNSGDMHFKNSQQHQAQTASIQGCEKLFDKLISGNVDPMINDNSLNQNLINNSWDFNTGNNSETGMLARQNDKNSYYDLIKSNNFKQIVQLRQQQQQGDLLNHSAYTDVSQFSNKSFDHRSLNPWNDAPIENIHPNSRQLQSNIKYPKKIVKSSTMLFNQETESSMQHQKHGQYFPHSVSYDNMNPFNKMKSTKPLMNDFLLDNSFNINGNKNNYYTNNLSNKNMLSQPMNTAHNNSVLNNSSNTGKDLPILHVRNLDYKISADEWKRILLENFRKHCKEILSVNVVTNADKSLLGIVKLATKDDARLAISCLHHKKIGYKRLNVTFATTNNSPKSKIVALLKTSELKEMPLTRFISLYEAKYNQSIAINELFSLKEIVQIFHKDGQGRQIKLIGRSIQSNLDNDEENLRHSPFCSLHSQKTALNYQMNLGNGASLANGQMNSQSSIIGWLPNVIVSLRTFKSAVHKLLNDHGGQMPLLSFMDCYKCCIFNDNPLGNNHRGNTNNALGMNQSNSSSSINSLMNANLGTSNCNDLSYQLIIDNENGVSLEHLITCAQDVQIQYNQGFFKQLQWENDKSKPINLQSRNSSTNNKNRPSFNEQSDNYCNDLDDSIEDSQRKLNQFSHEVVELFKEKPRCIIQMSNFTTEYHKKYGRQLRLADYDSSLYQNLKELLESIPHILQILDGQYDKKLTLTHRVQVRRFSNDLIKVLKSHPTKQMFADEYPISYEKHFSRKFDIKDYGVCYLEDMLAELPESIICRKEIEGRTFIQIPKIVQMDEERLCTNRLTFDIIDMLKHKPRFSIQFNKFIPNFHHHFGRQCKLSNYGFTKLIELLEAMPKTVHVINKDNLQFVQLKENIMLDLICANVVKYLEENNLKMKATLPKLEEIYNSRYEAIFYQDFGCENFNQLFRILPLKKHFISAHPLAKDGDKLNDCEWIIQSECFNEKELKRVCKLMLKKLIDEQEEVVLFLIKESKLSNKSLKFSDLCELLISDNQANLTNPICNNRSMHYLQKCFSDYLICDEKDENSIIGLSDLYVFAKQIRNIFKYSKLPVNDMTMTIPELEFLYNQAYVKNGSKDMSFKVEQFPKNSDNGHSCLPFKRLGFIDVTLLFSQGINLLVTVKKYAEKRICLNREFWSKNMTSDIGSQNISCESFSSPISPINSRVQNNNRTPFANITPFTNNSGTPISDRMSSSFSSNSINFSRRSVFNNTNSNSINNPNNSLCNTSSISNESANYHKNNTTE